MGGFELRLDIGAAAAAIAGLAKLGTSLVEVTQQARAQNGLCAPVVCFEVIWVELCLRGVGRGGEGRELALGVWKPLKEEQPPCVRGRYQLVEEVVG
ncbi:hypothetical protein ABW21_db0200614 [Orbilia brochopaga]|nr:hypothetical protein ABW21_db0200614 [Drechslerella brochopaga]